jgi:predicted HicB family RNase H-like nuclease
VTCSVPTCPAPPVARGLCARHYRAHLRNPGRELTAQPRRSEQPRPKMLLSLDGETLGRVTRLAAAAGQSLQDWVREAVEMRLERERP